MFHCVDLPWYGLYQGFILLQKNFYLKFTLYKIFKIFLLKIIVMCVMITAIVGAFIIVFSLDSTAQCSLPFSVFCQLL